MAPVRATVRIFLAPVAQAHAVVPAVIFSVKNVTLAAIKRNRARRSAKTVAWVPFNQQREKYHARHATRGPISRWSEALGAKNAGAAAQIAGELAAKGLVGATVKASHAPAGQARIAMERQEMFVSRVNRVNFRTKQARRTASRAPINRAVETAGG